jgi:hypothetical protein
MDGEHRLVVTSFLTPPAPLNGRPRAYPTTFYPGVRQIEDAQVVAVGYGEDQTGIDLRLQPVSAFTVSGRFDRQLTQPLLLRLMPQGYEDLAVGSEVATTVSDKDGAFTFLNVPAGAYTLMAQGPLVDMTYGFGIGSRLQDPPGYPSAGTGGGSYPGLSGVEVLLRSGVPSMAFGRLPLTVGAETKTSCFRSRRRRQFVVELCSNRARNRRRRRRSCPFVPSLRTEIRHWAIPTREWMRHARLSSPVSSAGDTT